MADIFYSPPEADIETGGSLRGVAGANLNPFSPTDSNNSLSNWLFGTSDQWKRFLTSANILASTIQIFIEQLTSFVQWLTGQFQGVPEEAKTAGTGYQMTLHKNPITPFLGGNLVAGAAKGLALSDGNYPHNFGARFIANAGAMIEFCNSAPPGSPWVVRNTPQSSIQQFGAPPLQYRINRVPPPPNAPYSDTVTIDGIFTEFIRTASDYQNQFGFPPPTGSQIAEFLNDTGGVLQFDPRATGNSMLSQRISFLQLWVSQYAQWLKDNAPGPTGPIPNPCQLPADPPCPPIGTTSGDQLTQLITAIAPYLYYITNNLTAIANAANSPQDALCCANIVAAVKSVTTQIASLQAELTAAPATPIDLTQIIYELTQIATGIQNSGANINALASNLAAPLELIRTAILDASGGTDVSGIVDQLKQWNANNIIPAAVTNQAVKDGIIPPQYSQLFSDKPADFVRVVIDLLAMLSSPIDMAKLTTGDSSSLSGGEKRIYDDEVRKHPAVFNALKGVVGLDAATLTAVIQSAFKKYLTANDTVVEPVLSGLLGALKSQLLPPAGTVTLLSQIGVNPDAPVASATGIALSAAIAAWVASGFGIEGGETLTKMVELIAGAIGFEELREVQIGPLVRNGIGAVAEMNAKKIFRQWLPGIGELQSLYARGMLTQAGLEGVLALHGVETGFFTSLELTAYHGLQPRQLIRAFESGLFTNADLTDEMTFSGMRPASQQRMLALAPYLATASQRSKFISAVEEAYTVGFMNLTTFQQYLANAEHITDAHELDTQAAQIKRGIANTLALEKSYTDLFVNGFTNEAAYRANLAGMGMDPNQISALAAIAENRQTLLLQRQQAAAEKVLERETAAIERRAALENFKRGNLTTATLAIALLATGLTATQAAAWTNLATLQQAGADTWVYGVRLTSSAAQLLRDRVAALTDQRKRELIDGTAYIKALQALNITEPFQNALLARANAQITPKKDAFATPVETK